MTAGRVSEAGDRPALEAAVVFVSPGDLYTPEKGYGFVTEKNRREQELLNLPELNNGFEPVAWMRREDLTRIGQDESGCFGEGVFAEENAGPCAPGAGDVRRSAQEVTGAGPCAPDAAGAGQAADVCVRQIPLCFKCSVPVQGQYRVTLTLASGEPMRDVRIFSGRRRLMEAAPLLEAGKQHVFSMAADVSDIVPRGQTEVFSDRTLDLTVTADRPCISRVTVETLDCPVVYIAGDSTVTDQSGEYPYAPETCYAGWGQMLPYFLTEEAVVSNHAHSGLTTESFRQEGHYGVVEKARKAGDYMLIQFGHNDQKLAHLQAREGYWDNLTRYIEESRAAGVFPLLVTPLARNTWKGGGGGYNDLLEKEAGACLDLGEKLHVPVLDLHGKSRALILERGLEASKPYFFPGDYTHTNDWGALLMASFICEEIRRVCAEDEREAYRKLASYVRRDRGIRIVPRKIARLQEPEGFSAASQQSAQDPLAGLTKPEDALLRADALDMVTKCAGFFQVNVYNDVFPDVVGHEWYAGTVECGLQNGILTMPLCAGGLFRPLEPVTLLDFAVMAMNAYSSRRELPAEEASPYDGKAPEWAGRSVRAAWTLGMLAWDGSDRLDEGLSRGHGAKLLHDLHIMR